VGVVSARWSRGRRVVAVLAAVTAACAAAAAACGPGSIADLTAGRRDAGSDAGDAGAPPEICAHALAPERPAGGDSTSLGELIFAVDALRIDTGLETVPDGIAAARGLDLDRTCTCPPELVDSAVPAGEGPSCVPRLEGGVPACDLSEGRDNAAGKLFDTLVQTTGSNSGGGAITKQIRDGVFGVLLYVQGYNGTANDPQVTFSMRVAPAVDGPTDAGRVVPRRDGTDIWQVDSASLQSGEGLIGKSCLSPGVICLARTIDDKAYVRDDVLVAHLDIPLRIQAPNGSIVVELVDATVTARITTDGALRRLTGEIVGRWPTDRILSTLGAIRDPFTNTSLCPPNPLYAEVKKLVCESADLAADPKAGRTAPCDALSDAFSFEAIPAKGGTVVQASDPPADCDAGFSDSCLAP